MPTHVNELPSYEHYEDKAVVEELIENNNNSGNIKNGSKEEEPTKGKVSN